MRGGARRIGREKKKQLRNLKAFEPVVVHLADPRKQNSKLTVRKKEITRFTGQNPYKAWELEALIHLKIWTIESLLLLYHGRRLEVYVLQIVKYSDIRKS